MSASLIGPTSSRTFEHCLQNARLALDLQTAVQENSRCWALSSSFTDENGIDVGPHQPMVVQWFWSAPCVEGPSYCIIRLDIDAYPVCLIFNEPAGHQTKQLRTYAGAA